MAFLGVLLDFRVLVLNVQGRHDPLGEDPSSEEPRRASGHPPIKDQLYPIRGSEIEIFTDDFLEELPSGPWEIQHLSERELGLEDRQVIAVPGARSSVRNGRRASH